MAEIKHIDHVAHKLFIGYSCIDISGRLRDRTKVLG
jgi:hypothetical protein